MYKIEVLDSSNITLVKNDNYWNKNNVNTKLSKISIKLYSEVGELYNSFKLGNIDVFTTSNLNLEQYIGTIGYSKTEFKGREFEYLAFNCQNKVLQNAEVRKAIYYAIDKANIISSIYNNQNYIADFPLDYGNYLYNKEINSEYSIDKAKSILTNSEWTYTGSRWQKTINKSTVRINLTLTVNSEDVNRLAIAENIKDSLEQAGIKITLEKVSPSKYKKILESKDYELLLTGVYNSYSPNLEGFFGNDNLQNYSNQEINKILSEVKSISDEKLLKEKYNKIIEIYEEERPFIGLSRNKISIIKGQVLSGEIKGNNYFSYYGLDSWYKN